MTAGGAAGGNEGAVRVGTILRAGGLGGVWTVARLLAEHGPENGYEYRVDRFHMAGASPPATEGEGAIVLNKDWQTHALARRIAASVPPCEVFHLHGCGLDFAVGWHLRRTRGTRLVYTVHGNSPFYERSVAQYQKMLDAVVALSSGGGEVLASRGHVPAGKLCVIHNGIDLPERRFERPSGGAGLRIAYVGRIDDKQKALSCAPGVLRAVAEAGVALHFDVIGDGPYRQELEAGLSSVLPGGEFTFHGLVGSARLGELLGGIDVLTMFSAYEGMSMALLESMAHGVVPVVTDVTGVADVVDDGRNGFRVPFGEWDRMAGQLAWLAGNRDVLAQMGEEARRTVEARFSAQRMGAAYGALFARVRASRTPALAPSRILCGRDLLDRRWLPNRVAVLLRRLLASGNGSRRS